MNVDQEEDNLSMMDIVDDEEKATVNDDATNDIEQLDLEESDETRMSKRMKNDDTEWIKVNNGVLATNYEKDMRDLQEINEKWKNQYEVLKDVEEMTNVIRKLDLSSSDEESVEKLFKEDSSEDEEVTNENTKKKIKIDENVEEKNVENVPPTNEQNYMIHDMDISDGEESENESEREIDLLITKSRKRKRNKKRSKPRKRKTRKNIENRETCVQRMLAPNFLIFVGFSYVFLHFPTKTP